MGTVHIGFGGGGGFDAEEDAGVAQTLLVMQMP